MRKKLKKIAFLILFFICIANFNEIAYAERIIPYVDWNISINLVGEAKRIYYYESDELYYEVGSFRKVSSSNSESSPEIISSKDVAIQIQMLNNVQTVYIKIDGINMGERDYDKQPLLAAGEKQYIDEENYWYYLPFVIRNLTPGIHEIEIKVDDPNLMSTKQKADRIYVNMLPLLEMKKIKT